MIILYTSYITQVYFTINLFTKYILILKIWMNNWRMVWANWNKWFVKKSVECVCVNVCVCVCVCACACVCVCVCYICMLYICVIENLCWQSYLLCSIIGPIRWRNLLLLLKSSCSHDSGNWNICVNLWQCFISLSSKRKKISSRTNENSMRSFT